MKFWTVIGAVSPSQLDGDDSHVLDGDFSVMGADPLGAVAAGQTEEGQQGAEGKRQDFFQFHMIVPFCLHCG